MKLSTHKIAFITALFCLFTTAAYSQKAWTLEECIDYALEHNITIKRQKIAAEQSRNDHLQAKFEMAPGISGRASHSFRSGRTFSFDVLDYVEQEYQYGQMTVDGNITIFNGLETQNTIKKTKYDMLAQLERIEEFKYDVSINIVTNYLSVLSNIEQKKIKEEQLKVTLDQIEQTQQMVDVGNKAKGDLLEIKAQAAREKLELIRAKNDLKMAYLDLTQLMNLDSAGNFRIIIPENIKMEQDETIKPTDDIYNQTVTEFPTIQNAEFQLKSAERNFKVMKGQRFPELSLGAAYGTYYNELRKDNLNLDYNTQITENISLVATLNLRIPIFNKLRIQNQISNAKLNVKDAEYQLNLYKQNLYKDIQKARNEAIAAFEEFQSNMEALESMKEAFNYSKEKYDVGLVDIVEYRLAKNNYNRAKSDAAKAKYFYIFKVKILEFYMGQEMEL